MRRLDGRSLAVMSALLWPPLATSLMFMKPRADQGGRLAATVRGALLAWSPLLLLSATRVMSNDWLWLAGFSLSGVIFFAAGARPPRPTLSLGLTLALSIGLVASVAERFADHRGWYSYSTDSNTVGRPLAWLQGVTVLTADASARSYGQYWTLPAGVSTMRFDVELRATDLLDSISRTTAEITLNPGRGVSPTPVFEVAPTKDWTQHSMEFTVASSTQATRLAIIARLEPGSSLEIRNLRLTADTVTLEQRPASERVRLWFTHPNTAGHVFAFAAIVALVSAGSFGSALLPVAFATGTILMTGSRTSLLALLTAVLVYAIGRLRRRHTVAVFALVLVTALAFIIGGIGRLTSIGDLLRDGNSVSRSEIWRFSLDLVSERPLHGWGESGFVERWKTIKESQGVPAVDHPHNLFLAFAAAYGLPGLLALLGTLVLAFRRSWHHDLGSALAVLTTLLILNSFDYTLIDPHVLALLGLSLGGLLPATDEPRLPAGS